MAIEFKHPVWLLCEIADISRSSYYKYKKRPLKKEKYIEKLIVDIYNKSNKRFGYRSIKATLKNQYNLTVNHKKIQRIMREKKIKSIIQKKSYKPQGERLIKKNMLLI